VGVGPIFWSGVVRSGGKRDAGTGAGNKELGPSEKKNRPFKNPGAVKKEKRKEKNSRKRKQVQKNHVGTKTTERPRGLD